MEKISTSAFLVLSFLYLGAVFLIVWHARTKGNMKEWILGDKPFGWIALGLSLFSSIFSAFTFVGLPGMVHLYGVSPFFMMILPVSTIGAFLIYLIGSKIAAEGWGREFLTPLDFFKARISFANAREERIVLRLIFFLFCVFIIPVFIVQIAGIAKLATGFFDNQGVYYFVSSIFTIMVWFYVKKAGIRGLVEVGVFQGAIAFLIVMGLFGMVLHWNHDMPGNLLALSQSGHLSLAGPEAKLPIGFLLGNVLAFGLSTISTPHIFHIILRLESRQASKKVAILFGLAAVSLGVMITVVGLASVIASPNLATPDMAVVEVIKMVFSNPELIALAGPVFCICVVAGAMSVMDSMLFTLSTSFAVGLFDQGSQDEATTKKRISLFTALMIFVCFLASLNPPAMIFKFGLIGIHFSVVLTPLLFGLFFLKDRITGKRALISIACGVIFFALGQAALIHLTGLGGAPWGFLAASVAILWKK